ncbi:uncharacterized protein LOC108594787 [Drosophila busckii]|uniref:uncharacterized protein LOC108594787 n=1 Tax=Drosophila busckii TaxID=30019 RepID=UPI00083EC6D4|nr:uncharacterized protein LOC108594787 [Drosophila busckii]
MWLPNVVNFCVIALALQLEDVQSKHWKRAPVRGAFNVDKYAYNKPVVNLVGQQAAVATIEALAMGPLLQQLAQRSQKSHYRNLDADPMDNYMPHNDAANATAAELIALPKPMQKQSTAQLEATSMEKQLTPNVSTAENLYSHEFQVQSLGSKKIVRLNTLTRRKAAEAKLKMQFSLPALQEQTKAETAAISALNNKPVEAEETPQQALLPTSKLTSNEIKLPSADGSEQQQVKPALQMANAVVSPPDNDGQSNDTALAAEAGAVKSKPKPRPKRTKSRRKQNQSKLSAPNATAAAAAAATMPAKVTATAASVKIPATKSPLSAKGKGKGKRRRPAAEQEIETTTNWWQILPYAEIRTFLNTIYDSITDDDDDERGQRI